MHFLNIISKKQKQFTYQPYIFELKAINEKELR